MVHSTLNGPFNALKLYYKNPWQYATWALLNAATALTELTADAGHWVASITTDIRPAFW